MSISTQHRTTPRWSNWARPDFDSAGVDGTGTARVVYIDGDARIAVVYHYDHPDEPQVNTYSKFIWSAPDEIGESTTSQFQIYDNAAAADIPPALAETNVIAESYEPPGRSYTKQ